MPSFFLFFLLLGCFAYGIAVEYPLFHLLINSEPNLHPAIISRCGREGGCASIKAETKGTFCKNLTKLHPSRDIDGLVLLDHEPCAGSTLIVWEDIVNFESRIF